MLNIDKGKLKSFEASDNYTNVKEATFRGCISLNDFKNFDNIETIERYGFEQTVFTNIN